MCVCGCVWVRMCVSVDVCVCVDVCSCWCVSVWMWCVWIWSVLMCVCGYVCARIWLSVRYVCKCEDGYSHVRTLTHTQTNTYIHKQHMVTHIPDDTLDPTKLSQQVHHLCVCLIWSTKDSEGFLLFHPRFEITDELSVGANCRPLQFSKLFQLILILIWRQNDKYQRMNGGFVCTKIPFAPFLVIDCHNSSNFFCLLPWMAFLQILQGSIKPSTT